MAHIVSDFAGGLIALGHRPSMAVAIVAPTSRQWLYCDLGILAAGGISVGVYPSMSAVECRAILAHGEVRICIVDGADSLARVRPCLDQDPHLEAIIVLDAAAVPGDDARIHGYDEVLERGRGARREVEARVAAIGPLDAALFLYTAGTTGRPRGVMFNHGNVVSALGSLQALPFRPDDRGYSYLPMAHCLQRIMDYYSVWSGVPTAYSHAAVPLRARSVIAELGELRPTVLATVPHLIESLHSAMYEDMQRTPAGKRLVLWANEVGRQVAYHRRHGREVPKTLQAQQRSHRALFSVWSGQAG
jgi:long-chain acyl-CoA synthetase